MNKVYVLAPLAGLLAFGGVYWKHEQAYTAKLAEQARADESQKQQKRAAHEAAQTKALEEAKQQVARRKQERADKERLEELQKQTRAELEAARTSAADRTRRVRPQIDRLRTDVEIVTAAIARAEERSRELRDEQQFLGEYVQRAESNRSSLYQLLERLEAAERQEAAQRRTANVAARTQS